MSPRSSSAGDSARSILRVVGGAMLTLLLAAPLTAGEFAPDIETSFESLLTDAATAFTQEYTFFDGQKGPAALLMEFDRGSFDFSDVEVDDIIGTLLIPIDIDNPFPIPDVVGDILGELTVTSVEDGVAEADMVVTEVPDDILDLLDLLDIADPTGEVAFLVTLTDLEDDDGVTIDMEEGEALPASDEDVPFELPMTFDFENFYTHSPDVGTLTVTTTITPGKGDDSVEEEEFKLDDGKGGGGDDPIFKRGDADGDGSVAGLPDGLFVLKWQFEDGAEEPPCMAAADADSSGDVSGIPDGLYLLRWQFEDEGPVIGDPGPDECGEDPDDILSCDTPPDCSDD